MPYKVLVDDNFHYQDEDERYEQGQFETYEAALEAAQTIVNEFLASEYRPGMTAEQLYEQYTGFGEDPFIKPHPDDRERFSAWDYAKKRCEEICTAAPAADPADREVVLSNFDVEIPKLQKSLQQIAENISYIERELPQLRMPDDIRTNISSVCDQFEWALIDTEKELRDLVDTPGPHSGEVPNGSKTINLDSHASVNAICGYIRDPILALNDLVIRLHNDSEHDPKLRIVFLLISESATNILKSISVVRESLNAIAPAVGSRPGT